MKRMILECGGKAANIVFDDCPDLQAVADGVLARAFWNQGEVCVASSRLLVQDGIKDELLAIIVKKVASLVPQDPLKSDTKFGAVVSHEHQQKVLRYIDQGQEEGATIAYRSDPAPPHAGGFYVAPVIFDGVAPEHRIAREEIFGPVLSVISFPDESEAIRIANSTIYGLSAIIWTKNLGRAHRVSHGIKAGWVVVNATAKPVGGPCIGILSVGGHQQSGIGVEGGIEGLEEYVSRTAVQLFV
jgi:acyl-CoA reductase-like NAD-dependent aldehyde dehydrogenase